MKAAFLLALFVAAALADSRSDFVDFTLKFNKQYASQEEFEYRYAVYLKNLELVAEMNNDGYDDNVFGVTKFMDLTPAEFKQQYLMNSPPERPEYPGPVCQWDDSAPISSSFDWQSKGAVTAVYNQAQCGSCWAFSVTEAIESKWFLAGNQLTQLSMQQIVSCDHQDEGCGGGWPYTAYEYVETAGGLEAYSDYPYTSQNGVTGQCKFNSADIVAKISSYCYITQSNNETAMASYLQTTAPYSICVDASSWQFYSGGVIKKGNCGREIDHCVMVTGFGTASDGTAYWTVRNSWGTDWGQQGYLQVQRGYNVCAISNIPSTPEI